MKHSLEFWILRFQQVDTQIWKLAGLIRSNQSEFNSPWGPGKRKLRAVDGCKLNSTYFGHKIGRRRRRWLRNRQILLTQMAQARSAITRLEITKLPFYAAKILELGGEIPRRINQVIS